MSRVLAADAWFQPITQTGEATLLCFPYAGAGASLFASWARQMFSSHRLTAVRLPGRETRRTECLRENLIPLAEEIALAWLRSEHAERPVAFLGSSLGAMLAFEVARALEDLGAPADQLIVVACPAPHRVRSQPRLHGLPEADFLQALQDRYEPLTAEMLANRDFMRSLLPILRADLKMFETYEFLDREPLGCPLLALGGDRDHVTPGDLAAWQTHTVSPEFQYMLFAGGHFFLRDCPQPVLRSIEEWLMEFDARPAASELCLA